MYNETADFSNLHDFFSRLASGDHHTLSKEMGLGKSTYKAPGNAMQTPRLLSSDDVGLRPTARPRARRVASKSGEKPAAFPIEDKFQFTFKLMIHELYNLADFAKMVAGVLAESQAKFKPLPDELKGRKDKETNIKAPETERLTDLRAPKKRCVAGRKPVVGSLPEDGGWIHDTTLTTVKASTAVDHPDNGQGATRYYHERVLQGRHNHDDSKVTVAIQGSPKEDEKQVGTDHARELEHIKVFGRDGAADHNKSSVTSSTPGDQSIVSIPRTHGGEARKTSQRSTMKRRLWD